MTADALPDYKSSDEIQQDIEYFIRKLERFQPNTIFWPSRYCYGPEADRTVKQIEALEDALIIYRISRGELS